MPTLAIGTVTTAGGGHLDTTLTPTNVFAENRQVAVVTTLVGNHGKAPHAAAVVAKGSPNVFAGPSKLPVAREGDLCSCAHPLLGGATTVIVN